MATIALVIAGAVLGLGGLGLAGVAAMRRNERKKREKEIEERKLRDEAMGKNPHGAAPRTAYTPYVEEPAYDPIPIDSPLKKPGNASLKSITRMRVEHDTPAETDDKKAEKKRLLKTLRDNDRKNEDKATEETLQELHPTINVKDTLQDPAEKELQNWLANHNDVPQGVNKYNVKLNFPGELLGIKWNANSHDDPIQIFGMEPGKAGQRNKINPTGWLVSVAGHEITNPASMAEALTRVKEENLTEFDIFTTDDNPKGKKFKRIIEKFSTPKIQGTRRSQSPTHMITEEIHADWVDGQEQMAEKRFSPIHSYTPLRNAHGRGRYTTGNERNHVQLGRDFNRKPSWDYASHENRVQNEINSKRGHRQLVQNPFQTPDPNPSLPAHLHRHHHASPSHHHKSHSDPKYHVAPQPNEQLLQYTRTAPSVGPGQMDAIGHPAFQ
eukprot:TRINITY_DN3977_c0_g2_i1.p1 TRINITY_DN3977_c0_g2~~TRINITY_DN3977_c0_g2_i1.p1  ORF type:complete len:439 (+),score=52.29 TRINITY_DN3977_c0_g2_i1:70-1386(+)